MIRRPSTLNVACRSAIAFALAVNASPSQLSAQEAVPRGESRFILTDTKDCISCHINAASLPQTDFVDATPAGTWKNLDKHSRSFELLKDKSRKLTDQILGFDLELAFRKNSGGEADFSKLSDVPAVADKVEVVKACLRCHATWPAKSQLPSGNTKQPVVDLNLGVSCQGCHGPAIQWDVAHRKTWWRKVAAEEKSRLGMTNLRDPVVKAQTCVSCHVGSVEEERFVRHEWYAAGHPPLPGFELASFAAQMPSHWKPLSEKPDFAGRTNQSKPVADDQEDRALLRAQNVVIPDEAFKGSYMEANSSADNGGKGEILPRFQELTASSAAVARAYVKLVGEYAEKSAAGDKSRPWPEFSLYDCAACHHELRRDGLHSRPARRGPPGRPPMAMWTTALLPLAVEQAKTTEPSFQALETAFTNRAFGDPKQISAAAKGLQKELDQLCGKLVRAKFDEESAKRALVLLTSDKQPGVDLRDYASARQIAWAIRELRKDQERLPYGFSAEPIQRQKEIDALFSDGSRDPLSLSLPARRDSIVTNLPASLAAMFDFDHQWFKERLKALREK